MDEILDYHFILQHIFCHEFGLSQEEVKSGDLYWAKQEMAVLHLFTPSKIRKKLAPLHKLSPSLNHKLSEN